MSSNCWKDTYEGHSGNMISRWWDLEGKVEVDRDGSCSKSRFSELLCLACVMLSCSVISDSATSWTVALQAPLFMGILQARILEWGVFPTRGLNPHLLHCRQIILLPKPPQKRNCKWNWVKVRLFDQRRSPWPLKALEFLFALLSLLFLDFQRTSESEVAGRGKEWMIKENCSPASKLWF